MTIFFFFRFQKYPLTDTSHSRKVCFDIFLLYNIGKYIVLQTYIYKYRKKTLVLDIIVISNFVIFRMNLYYF